MCVFSDNSLAQYAPDFVRKMYRTRKELMNLLIKDVKLKKQSMFKQVLENSKTQINKFQSRSSQAKDDGGGGSSGDERRSGGEVSKSKSLAKIMRKRTVDTPTSLPSTPSTDRSSGSQIKK